MRFFARSEAPHSLIRNAAVQSVVSLVLSLLCYSLAVALLFTDTSVTYWLIVVGGGSLITAVLSFASAFACRRINPHLHPLLASVLQALAVWIVFAVGLVIALSGPAVFLEIIANFVLAFIYVIPAVGSVFAGALITEILRRNAT